MGDGGRARSRSRSPRREYSGHRDGYRDGKRPMERDNDRVNRNFHSGEPNRRYERDYRRDDRRPYRPDNSRRDHYDPKRDYSYDRRQSGTDRGPPPHMDRRPFRSGGDDRSRAGSNYTQSIPPRTTIPGAASESAQQRPAPPLMPRSHPTSRPSNPSPLKSRPSTQSPSTPSYRASQTHSVQRDTREIRASGPTAPEKLSGNMPLVWSLTPKLDQKIASMEEKLTELIDKGLTCDTTVRSAERKWLEDQRKANAIALRSKGADDVLASLA